MIHNLGATVHGDPEQPGLLVLPGVMADASTWRHVAAAITAWPSVTVVDRRGRASSPPLGEGYGLATEVADLVGVLDEVEPAAVLGWSYGATITLLAANQRAVPHLVAYEPVGAPFGRDALPALAAADAAGDLDRAVEVVNTAVSGYDAAHVDRLRRDERGWATLRHLAAPLHAELSALNAAPLPPRLAQQAGRLDLVIGTESIGVAPYGPAFEDVRTRLGAHEVHELPGHGHLAHVTGPADLARLVDGLRR